MIKLYVLSTFSFGISRDLLRSGSYSYALRNERLFEFPIWKVICRVFPTLTRTLLVPYYFSILIDIYFKKSTHLLIIRGELVPVWFVKISRLILPNIKIVGYTWDSRKNNPRFYVLEKFMDKRYTFDLKDSLRYSIPHLPLFYFNSHNKMGGREGSKITKIAFFGTIHSERLEWIKLLVKLSNRMNFEFDYHLFVRSKAEFHLLSQKNQSYGLRFSTESLTYKELSLRLDAADIIIDIAHPSQSGLTLRTFEALSRGKILVTNNKVISKYNLEMRDNIFIADLDSLDSCLSFVLNSPHSPSEVSKVLLSLESELWLNNLVNMEESELDWREKHVRV